VSDIDPRFTSPEERRDFWPIGRLLIGFAVLALGGRWLVSNYPDPFLDQSAYLAKTQRENDRILRFYVEALAGHRESDGVFPLSLVDLLRPTRVPGGIVRGIPPRDAWNHPLRYFSDGEIYLLVSVGRAGEPQTEDYHEMREARLREAVCADPDADLVVSDRGWHQRCDPDLETPAGADTEPGGAANGPGAGNAGQVAAIR
jgi:hypothetical protein